MSQVELTDWRRDTMAVCKAPDVRIDDALPTTATGKVKQGEERRSCRSFCEAVAMPTVQAGRPAARMDLAITIRPAPPEGAAVCFAERAAIRSAIRQPRGFSTRILATSQETSAPIRLGRLLTGGLGREAKDGNGVTLGTMGRIGTPQFLDPIHIVKRCPSTIVVYTYELHAQRSRSTEQPFSQRTPARRPGALPARSSFRAGGEPAEFVLTASKVPAFSFMPLSTRLRRPVIDNR